jgi:hypothetical protein
MQFASYLTNKNKLESLHILLETMLKALLYQVKL